MKEAEMKGGNNTTTSGFKITILLPCLLSLFLATALITSAIAGCSRGNGGGGDALTTRAREIVDYLVVGDYAYVVESFDATMQEALPTDQLEQAWDSLLQKAGSLQEISGVRIITSGANEVAFVTCRFENMYTDVKIVFDDDMKIAGLFFVPTQGSSEYEPPAYIDPDSFTEQEVTVGNGEWSLPGTLTMPKGEGPFPAVVLVHGSGPNNRNEGGSLIAPFRDLAWGLASQGIAVLRYDKRTLVYQDRLAAQGGDITVWEETVDDAAAAVDLLLLTEDIDASNVFVLGHSLGGMLIPRIAGVSPQARGFVILAGVARPFEDLLLEQTEYIASLDGVVTPDEQAMLDQTRKAVAKVKSPDLSPSTPASELPFGAWGGYWLDLRGYDPADSARGIGRPVLILQGGRDYQVTMEDFQRWEDALSAMPNVTFKTYSDLNHLFVTGTGKSVPSEYNLPGHVAQEVVDDIASFIKDNLAGG
jgi:fermentation-respiration switch protein FrsA (DUF1100 family)